MTAKKGTATQPRAAAAAAHGPASDAPRFRPGEWLVRRAAKGHPVTSVRLGRQRLVHLLGADANALVFAHDAWSMRPDPAATVSWDT